MDLAPGMEQVLADLYCLGEGIRRVLQRGEQKVSQSVVVCELETVLEGLGHGVIGVCGEGGKALAHIARRRGAGFLAQDAGRSPIVGHGHHRRGLDAQREQGADGNGRTRAAADDDRLGGGSGADHGKRIAQGGESLGLGAVGFYRNVLLRSEHGLYASFRLVSARERSRWVVVTQ